MLKRDWKYEVNVKSEWRKAQIKWVVNRESAWAREAKIGGWAQQVKISNKQIRKKWIELEEGIGSFAWNNKAKGKWNWIKGGKWKCHWVWKCKIGVKSERIEWLHLSTKIEHLDQVKINGQTGIESLNELETIPNDRLILVQAQRQRPRNRKNANFNTKIKSSDCWKQQKGQIKGIVRNAKVRIVQKVSFLTNE